MEEDQSEAVAIVQERKQKNMNKTALGRMTGWNWFKKY